MPTAEELLEEGNGFVSDGADVGGEDEKDRDEAQNNRRLGFLIVLAVEAMLFAGVLAALVVLKAGTESVPAQGGNLNAWLPLGIGAIALFTLELARRHTGGGLRLTAHWGCNLALLAAVAWLVVSSDALPGDWGKGGLAELSPVEGCRLILQTLLALHVLATFLLTGRTAWNLLRGTGRVGNGLAEAEQMWLLTLAVQGALAISS